MADRPAMDDRQRPALDAEPTNVLVVDDLPEKLLAYRAILEELGQSIVTATSGEEALREVLKTDFAVILLDIQLPGLDGLETAALIRQRKRSAHTPIIFLTAFADEVRVAEGYAQGAVDYITTPVVPAVLRAKVRVFCDLYRMTRLVRRQAEEHIALSQERTKREAAEEANSRLAFSAWTGSVLGQSLDGEVTTREVARLPVPFLADSVLLVLVSPRGSRSYRVARAGDGETVVEAVAEPSELPADLIALSEATLAGTAGPGADESVLSLPLRAQDRTFGAVVLSRAPSRRTFAPPDRTLATAFASRAAVALENARLYHELQQADRRKNDFLSMLAHELRNPLAPIRNANTLLATGPGPDRVRWAHGVIDRQLTHMVRLVDDLLDVSRLTLGKIHLAVQSVELGQVLEQAIEAVRPLVAHRGHHLEVVLPSHPIVLTGDPARLTQVFTNLLNNAAKYTEPGGRITLSACLDVTRPSGASQASGAAASCAEIRLVDTGIGIAADFLSCVFDPFTQADASLDRSQGGLGVGLTLVRQLVEMHGGTVEARSEGLGLGSEFVVRIPAVFREPAGHSTDPGPPTEPSPRRNTRRVVIVDDNVDGAESLGEIVALMGHDVRLAHDGPTGIRVIREFDPDLVLLDIGLPGMNGYEVARQLKRDLAIRAVLVALSGYGREQDRAVSREAGFAQHYVKPMDYRTLEAVLGAL